LPSASGGGWLKAPSPLLRYGCAVVATLLALLLKLALGPIILPSLYVPFYGAVLVSAWVGGVGPGVVASVLSFGIGQVLYSPPLSPPASDAQLALARDALFLLAAIGLSWGTAALHASQRRVAEVLQTARDELEGRVALRTAELREVNRQLTDEMARRAEAEQRFRNAFEYAPIGMALVSPDGQALQINAALCEMLGYTHEELLRKPIAEVMHPDDFASANADRTRLLAGETACYQAERRYVHRSGTLVWAEMNVSVVRDGQGRPLHLVSHLHDITDRHRAQAELEESERRFRGTFAQAAVGIAHVAPDGRFLRINDRFCQLVGYAREEMLERTFQIITHPADLDADLAYVRRMLDGEIATYAMEKRYIGKAGSPVWVDLFVSLVRDAEGRPEYFIAVAQDISERKRAEEALRQSERLLKDQARWLQSILNSLGEAVVVADAQGKLLYFNPVAERLHGRGPADVAVEEWSKEYGVYFPEGTAVPVDQFPLAQARLGIATTAGQEFVIRPSGQDVLIPVSATATPLVSEDGSIQGGVVVYRDISNIKEAETRLRRNEQRLKEAERLAHTGAWEWNLTTNEAIWSDEQFRIFGLEPAESPPPYDAFLPLISPEDRPRVVQVIADMLAGPGPFEVECRIVRPHGEIRHVYVRGEIVRDAAGKPIRMMGTVVDITERKEAESLLESRVAQRTAQLQEANHLLQEEIRQRREVEAALRDSEERFRATFEQVAVGVAMVGPDGRWLLVNDRLCQILGYPRDELMQLTFRSITFPEDLPTSLALVGQLVSGQTETFTTEKRYVRKDGSAIWGSMTGSAVRDSAGNFKYGIAVLQDISARKQAEGEVRTAEQRLRRLVEHLPAITYVLALDEAQTTLYVSPQIEAALGFAPAEWTGDPDLWNRQLHPDDRQRVIAEVAASHATGAPFSSEYRMFARDGTLRWFHDEAAVIRDQAGQLLFSQGVMIDITTRKQAEEELEAVNRRTRDILEEVTDGFYTLDLEGRFTYLNPSALRLFERSADQLLGKQFWEAFPEVRGSVFDEEYQRLKTERLPISIEAYYGPRNRWYRLHGYPTQQGASVLFEDVTERHELEAATMGDILGALNAHLQVADAFPAVAAGLRRLTGCDRSSVSVFEDDDEWMRLVALDEPREYLREGVRLRIADVPAVQDVLNGRPHVVRDLAAERSFPAVRLLYASGYRSRLSVPLRGRERILGILNLLWREPDGPSMVQLPLINQVGAIVALALEKGRLFDEVRAGRERLEALSQRLLQVQEAERQHIARELHDEIGQALTALKLSLDTVKDISLEDVPARLDETQRQVNELLGRVRNLALDLRPAMLDDLGLLPALLWLFERYSAQAGVQVTFEHRGLERRFNPEIETAAYRIVQEALTNVARHARVRDVTVRSWSDASSLSVQIVDQGRGFDARAALAAGASSGMAGMRERVLLLAGQFAVESTPGEGTRVSAELPLNGRVHGASDGVATCL
jgi:PAS domain S-box-containing protein